MTGPDTEVLGQQSIETKLKELGDYLSQSQERQHRLRRWNKFTTLAILFVFTVFIFLFYYTIKINFAAEKFSKSIRNHTAELVPSLTEASLEVMTDIQPVYLEAARKKSETYSPEFMIALENQTDIFIRNMSAFGEKEFQDRLEKLVEGVAQEFRKTYPDLTNDQIEAFIQDTEDDLNIMFLEISEHIINQSLPEMMEMKSVSASMAEQQPKMDEAELYKMFLHKILVLLDMEIMED